MQLRWELDKEDQSSVALENGARVRNVGVLTVFTVTGQQEERGQQPTRLEG